MGEGRQPAVWQTYEKRRKRGKREWLSNPHVQHAQQPSHATHADYFHQCRHSCSVQKNKFLEFINLQKRNLCFRHRCAAADEEAQSWKGFLSLCIVELLTMPPLTFQKWLQYWKATLWFFSKVSPRYNGKLVDVRAKKKKLNHHWATKANDIFQYKCAKV